MLGLLVVGKAKTSKLIHVYTISGRFRLSALFFAYARSRKWQSLWRQHNTRRDTSHRPSHPFSDVLDTLLSLRHFGRSLPPTVTSLTPSDTRNARHATLEVPFSCPIHCALGGGRSACQSACTVRIDEATSAGGCGRRWLRS